MPRRIGSAICAIVKNEGRYILEWLAYHRMIGFEHVFLYDNESTDDTFSLVKAYITEGFLTYISWPSGETASPQRAAYQHFADFLAPAADWFIYLDGDEFVNLKKHDTVAAFLQDYDDLSGIALNWRMFGDGGETEYRSGLVIERFQKASRSDFFGNSLVKTFVRARDMQLADVHNPQLTEGMVTLTASRGPIPSFPLCNTEKNEHDVAQINHYFVKSPEEWSIKRRRGRADLANNAADRIRPNEEFAVYNRNEENDTSILRKLGDVKSELARLDLVRR